MSAVQQTAEIGAVFQHLRAAQDDVFLRFFGYRAGDVQRIGHGLAQAEQIGSAAGKHNTVVEDIRRELRRGMLQHAVDAFDQLLQRLVQRFDYIVGM